MEGSSRPKYSNCVARSSPTTLVELAALRAVDAVVGGRHLGRPQLSSPGELEHAHNTFGYSKPVNKAGYFADLGMVHCESFSTQTKGGQIVQLPAVTKVDMVMEIGFCIKRNPCSVTLTFSLYQECNNYMGSHKKIAMTSENVMLHPKIRNNVST